MRDAFICDAIRTPIGRYGGGLASVRTDNLAAHPIKELMARNKNVDWGELNDVIYGCANQAGEDNRNVARMAALLAGLPVEVAGVTLNRLCGSSMEAVGQGARAIKCGDADLVIAGGVESMSRAPFVIPKSDAPFSRNTAIYDTTIGWRFVNRTFEDQYGIDSMPETAENLAEEFSISREDQDAFAYRSQQRTRKAQDNGYLAEEIVSVTIPQRRGDDIVIEFDEHPRADTTLESLAKLSTPFRKEGTITAGNASGVNDGACALLVASEDAVKQHQLTPKARILTTVSVGVPPRIMGFGPVPATRKALGICELTLQQMDVIEINEAFAAQVLTVTRELGLADDAEQVNSNGGAIALGHPLGMSGARLITTAVNELVRRDGHYALCTMCIGVGQGIATIIERV
jgi:acetyl-CoA acyltransferase